MPVPRTAAAVVPVVLAAALVALAATGHGGPTSPPAGRADSADVLRGISTPPVPTSRCAVSQPSAVIDLSPEQARQLTTRAAHALASGTRPVGMLAAEVRDLTGLDQQRSAAVARTLSGARDAGRLSCSFPRADVPPEKAGHSGLTPRARKLRRAWTAVFGPLVAGGFSPNGVSSGHVDNSAHYEGRAVDVFFRPLGRDAQRRRGWVFAQWLAAHAERYHVLSIIYSDHIWTSWASSLGFRDYQHPGGPTRNPVLRHLDHVHVAVESGRPFRPG